jgi:pimeloyl-ACP methyl ester carboxylesterase
MRYPMTVIAIVAGFYVLICVAAYVLQARMVFFPERNLDAAPSDIGLDYSDAYIDTEDGVRLHGWFIPGNGAQVVLFLHGNAGNISHRLDSIRIFNRLGLSVLAIDYRGYGRSTGRISEKGTYADAHAAWRYLRDDQGFDASHIVLFGRSLGSAVAIELATHARPRALIAESAYTSVPDVGAHHYRLLPVRLLARIRYNSLPRVAAIDCPKLFIHSPSDEIAPFRLAQRLFAAAAEPKTFLEISGDHNSGFVTSGAVYVEGLRRFLASID